MNVLFVDDQSSVLDGIAACLHFEKLGIERTYYASSAADALELLSAHPINVVLTDIEMPGEDGIWLLRMIRERYPEILTVMLTSHSDFEYAQESIHLRCFDYLVQPAPPEEIERVLRRAMQYLYERNKHNQLYEVGRRMQTGAMELLDGVTMNLFSAREEEVRASLELLTLLGYPVTEEKHARLLMLTFEQFHRSDTSAVSEKEIHKHLAQALKEAEFSFPIVSLSTVNHEKQFVLLLFSALEDVPELAVDRLRAFFERLCKTMPEEVIRCFAGGTAPFNALRSEYRHVRDVIDGKVEDAGILRQEYEANHSQAGNSAYITGSGARWRSLLASGQHRILMNEFEQCLEQIEILTLNKAKALCDLHQRVTHMFFNYFYENRVDMHELFHNQYSYNTYMNSYSDAASLRNAMTYMMKQVKELRASQAPQSDVEKAKTFVSDHLADHITVRDVAEHMCLSAEYFTKLFKKETGQNIKEYITLTKVEAAKDMLERADIPVSIVALELGYTNFSHFTQVFKKYERITPSEYRSRSLEEQNK